MSAARLKALLAQAIAQHRAGRLDEAELNYRAILKQDPKHSDALNLLGLVLQAKTQRDQALLAFNDAIKNAPHVASFHYNRANLLIEMARGNEALRDYQTALKLQPVYPDAWLNFGALLYKRGDLAGAISAFKEMTKHSVGDARGHFNLGRCLAERQDYDAAQAALEYALTLKPDYSDAFITLAKVYADRWRFKEAIPLVQKALEMQPRNFMGWANLGTYLAAVDDHDGARKAYDQALAINPDYADAEVNRGLTHLVRGNLAAGWDGNASVQRARAQGAAYKIPKFPWPQWNGEPLDGKRVFVWAEQGLGDQVLYAGMISEIAKLAQKCVLVCSDRLVSLFERSFPNVTVVPLTENWNKAIGSEPFDYHTSLIDLGRWRRRTLGPSRIGGLI